MNQTAPTSVPQSPSQKLWQLIASAPSGFSADQLAVLETPSLDQRTRGELLIEKLVEKKFTADQLRGSLLTLRAADRRTIEFLTDPVQIDSTVALLARGRLDSNKQFLSHQGAELTLEIMQDVLRSPSSGAAPQAKKILATMTTYDGSPAELREFIYTLGAGGIGTKNQSLNPFLIASQIEIVYPLYTTDEAARKTTGATVQHPYQLERPTQAPGKVYLAGQQAVMAILGAFGGETFSREKRAETSSRRTGESNAFLATLRLHDLINPDVATAVGRASRLLARHTQIAQELQQYIDALRATAKKLEQTMAPTAPLSRVFGYEGGSLWNRIKAQKNLPNSVKVALGLLEDPLYSSSPEERRTLRLAVVAYGLLHLQFVGSGLLAGYAKDLTLLEGYAKVGTLATHAQDVTAAKLADIREQLTAAQQKSELSLTELGEMTELVAPIVEFRKQRNLAQLQRFQSSIDAAVKLGKQLFQRQGAWLADSVGEEVPMGRLGSHILSQKFACIAGSRREGAVLSRQDFAALRTITRVVSLVGTPEGQAVSYPVEQFAASVQAAVIAIRKVEAIQNQLAAKKSPLAARFDAALSADEALSAQELAPLKLVTLPNKHLMPLEVVQEKYGMEADDLISRITFAGPVSPSRLTYAELYSRAALARSVNLHAKAVGLLADFPAILQLSPDHPTVIKAKLLVPEKQLTSEYERLRYLHRHNQWYNTQYFRDLSTNVSAQWTPLMSSSYASPERVSATKSLMQALTPVYESFVTLEQAGVQERLRLPDGKRLAEDLYSEVALPDGSVVKYLDAAKYLQTA